MLFIKLSGLRRLNKVKIVDIGTLLNSRSIDLFN